jgi:hypothetical protein
MNAIDTNIWVCCHDSRDAEKQRVAQTLIETAEPTARFWDVEGTTDEYRYVIGEE